MQRIDKQTNEYKLLSSQEKAKATENHLMGNRAIAAGVYVIRTAARSVPGLAMNKKLLAKPASSSQAPARAGARKPGAVVFDETTVEGQGKVGTGDVELFISSAGTHNEAVVATNRSSAVDDVSDDDDISCGLPTDGEGEKPEKKPKKRVGNSDRQH